MSGYRGLNLDELLGPEYAWHYLQVLTGHAPPPAQPAAQRPGTEATVYGSGPEWCSSSTALALSPEICWDVSGWYARLGAHWRATRRELRLAYLARGGDADEELHYALMQLLDPVIRRAYDSVPLGGVFLGDRQVADQLKRAAAQEAARRAQGGEVTGMAEVLREWDLQPGEPSARGQEMGAQDAAGAGLDQGSPLGASLSRWSMAWSWYALGPLGRREMSEAGRRLETWQMMLCRAFTRLGVTVQFSVGLHAGHGPRHWQGIRERCIFFLGSEDPAQEMANEAAEGHVNRSRRTIMPTPTKGAEAAEEIAETARRANRRFRAQFLTIKDGDDRVFIRPVTEHDQWIVVSLHQFIPSRPAPEGVANWPKSMWFTCQNDIMFREGGKSANPYEPGYGECWIHQHYAGVLDQFKKDRSIPAVQTLGLCVLREPVKDPANPRKTIGFRDITEEVTLPGGDKATVPAIRVINQKYSNFWASIKAAAFTDDAVTNKDFMVQRTGNDYEIVAVNTTDDHHQGTESWKTYTDALELLGINIEEMILDHATPEHYARFLEIEGTEPPAAEEVGETAAAGGQVDEADVEDFRKRLQPAAK